MINPRVKNIEASVKGRLLNLARQKKRPFQQLLQYYGMERFLYRLSRSRHSNSFILKGGLLFGIWDIQEARATLDIDLLGRTLNTPENLVTIIEEVCCVDLEVPDGIRFSVADIKVLEMQLQRKYAGKRLKFRGHLGSCIIPMQIDVGFGDVVIPDPDPVPLPTILDFPPPRMKTYHPETVFAEKLYTMLQLGGANSRLKDYYDAWLLIQSGVLSPTQLYTSINATFQFRGLLPGVADIPDTLASLEADPSLETKWEQFRSRNAPLLNIPGTVREVLGEIRQYLSRLYG